MEDSKDEAKNALEAVRKRLVLPTLYITWMYDDLRLGMDGAAPGGQYTTPKAGMCRSFLAKNIAVYYQVYNNYLFLSILHFHHLS